MEAVKAALVEAESRTSGQIRASIPTFFRGEVRPERTSSPGLGYSLPGRSDRELWQKRTEGDPENRTSEKARMKVWIVMSHEGASEDDAGTAFIERVFSRESEALAYLEEHVARTECGLERVLPGSSSFHPRKVPVARCLCDEQGWSIDEWEVEEA